MFDIGFSEIIVCSIVALIVIGPERLPETVRTVGLWVGRIKRSLRETREDLERQVGMEDIRRQLHTEEMMRTLDNMQDEIDTALNYERMGSKSVLEHQPIVEERAINQPINQDNKSLVNDTTITTDIQLPLIKPAEKSETALVHH